MNPSALALLSVLCYALAAVILEQKLAGYSTALLVATVSATVCVFSLANHYVVQGSLGTPIAFPQGPLLWWLAAACVAWYFADTFYVGSFAHGGSLHSITTIMLLLPVIAALIRLAWIAEAPAFYQITGYAFVSAGTLLVIYGDQYGWK